jgi:hypothetical protein
MAILTEEDRLSYRIVFLVAIVVLLAVPVTAVRVLAALVILCYLPAAPFAARAGTSFPASLALTVTASPIMVALPVLVVVRLGLPIPTAVWAIVGIAMAQFLVYGTQRAFTPTRDEKRAMITLGILLVAAALLTMWLPVTNPWWRVREDSWFHAAVYNRIANHGLPVVDPYFSPLRLQYMYFYHILLLTISTITGLGPFAAMIFANLMALGGCILGVNYLVELFTRRRLSRWLAVALCVFGLNGLFYLFFPIRLARALLGETTGVEILRHFFTLSPLGHETALRFLSIEGNQFMFLDKFMLGTAFSLTLGMTCVVLALLVSMRARRWNWILTFFYVISVAGIMFLHLIMGAAVIVATAGTMVVLALVGPRGRSDRGDLTVGRQAVFTALALGITLPYLVSVLPHQGGERAVGLALQPHQMIGIVAGIFAALIPALWYLARVRSDGLRRREGGLTRAGVIAVWASFALVVALLVDLPTINERKLVFPLYFALVALAAAALDRWVAAGARGRRAAAAYVLLCTVPLNAVYFGCAFADRSTYRLSESEMSVYEWIRKTTDENALFLEENDITRIPVLAARDQYWGTEEYALNWDYPESELKPRRALRDAVYGERELDEAVFAHARRLGRPMYIVLRNIHTDGGKRFEKLSKSPYLTGKYMTENIAIFEVRFPGRDDTGSG